MRVLGVDSSSSLSGCALAVDGELVELAKWKPPKKVSKNDSLLDWFVFVGQRMQEWNPDIVGYEIVRSSRNMNTVRILAYWESAVVVNARMRRKIVQSVSVKQAREIVFSDGKIEKEEVLATLRARYPRLSWSASNAGGLDEADAGTVALATPDLLERR